MTVENTFKCKIGYSTFSPQNSTQLLIGMKNEVDFGGREVGLGPGEFPEVLSLLKEKKKRKKLSRLMKIFKILSEKKSVYKYIV